MKNTILRSLLIALIAVFINLSFAGAQMLKDMPAGPNGGNMFPTNVKNQKIELKITGNKASFYVINAQGQNSKLTAAAATADVLIDYNAVQPAVNRQVTITSKNKFEVTIPPGNVKPNFIAIHANYNGDIIEARFILRDLSQEPAVAEPAK